MSRYLNVSMEDLAYIVLISVVRTMVDIVLVDLWSVMQSVMEGWTSRNMASDSIVFK